MYNASLHFGSIPSDWKQSNVGVHKSGCKDDPSNFRPISVVPVLAKILEKLVASQLSTYFENFQLLNPYQGAYHIGRSTEQILLFAVDTITQALDACQVVCTACLSGSCHAIETVKCPGYW